MLSFPLRDSDFSSHDMSSISASTDVLHALVQVQVQGMDLNLNSATATPTPASSSTNTLPQMDDTIFDPMFTTSFEDELKPLEINMPSSFDMNIQYRADFDDSSFDPIIQQVKPEILPIEDNWPQLSDETASIFDTLTPETEGPYFNTTSSQEGFGGLDDDQSQSQLMNNNGGLVDSNGFDVDAGGIAHANFVVDNGQGLYQYYTHHQQPAFGDFHVGTTWNVNHTSTSPTPANMIERRRRRMIKNRESAARSRARTLAHNAQQRLEIEKLKEENVFLKRVLRTLVDVVSMQIQNEGISRTFSAPLPPQSRL